MPRLVGGDQCSGFKNSIGRTFLSSIEFSPRLDFVVSSVERKPGLSVKPRSVGGELHYLKYNKKMLKSKIRGLTIEG
jgi:hypothetical protein